jgi:hypothetical protein
MLECMRTIAKNNLHNGYDCKDTIKSETELVKSSSEGEIVDYIKKRIRKENSIKDKR